MSLSLGIVGLPNVGKSTLFNALTNKSVEVANYPFCTIDPSVGVVAVPDARLERLSTMSASKKTVPAAVEFVDIAGLVKGASEGEGLGNKFLANIRETDAIVEVVRLFDDLDITHVSGGVDPLRDIETINLELVLADLETVAKRLSSLEREVRSGSKEAQKEKEALRRAHETLLQNRLLSTASFDEEAKRVLQLTNLLTIKPILYALNKKAGGYNLDEQQDERWAALMQFFKETNARFVVVDAGIESELRELAGEDKEQFRRELGAQDDGVSDLIRAGYDLLGLITFFTTGEKETRAWTTKKGSTALEAAAAIHTDFRSKFIRAEVIAWDTLLEAGSYAASRERGFLRTEGKEYVVQDGDVMEFKI